MRGEPAISGVYDWGEPEACIDPMEEWGRLERLRRMAWHRGGFVAVRVSELPDDLAQQITTWAEAQYGRRKT